MKKLLLTILLTIVGIVRGASQEATVKDFEATPMDVTAQQYSRLDLHGVKCALVKVQVVAPGVSFSGNVMGEVEKRGSEYWVYLSQGTKMLKITAETFLPLMYKFPEPLKSGVTYILRLQAPQAAGMSGQSAASRANYLVLRVSPASARVIVDGKDRLVNDGIASVRLEAGTHNYRVEATGYASQEGTVIMAGKKLTRSVELVSTMPTLTVTAATPGTEIFVNDERKGTDNWSARMLPDTYTVEGRLAGYRTFNRSITLTESQTQTIAIPALNVITGTLNVEYTPVDAIITIDGRDAGVTPNAINDLAVGTHSVTISKNGYTPVSLTAIVNEMSPTTLTGSLSPLPADISLTDQYVSFYDPARRACGYKYNNNVVIPPKFNNAFDFNEGMAPVQPDENWGFIDKTGSLVIPDKYVWVGYFSESLAPVKIDGKVGFIDKSDTLIIPAKYDDAWSFSKGMAAAKINGKWGYIDRTGTMVIQAEYDEAENFSEGVAKVQTNGKYGFIDNAGAMVIPAKYDDAYSFSHGKARVKLGGRWYAIDRNGNKVE